MTDTLATYPSVVEIATPELIPLGVDFTKRLGSGESVTGIVSVTISDPRDGALVPLAISGSPSFTTTVVTQTIDGSALFRLPNDVYWEYVVTAQIGSRRESTITKLKVLF